MTAVGFVGAGMMGEPMVRALVAAGHRVTVHDVDPARTAALRAQCGAAVTVADSPTALGGLGYVITMLPTSDIVETVVLQQGLADALGRGALLADMSSSEPARTVALGAALVERGLAMVDAPVSGGVARARSGTLTVMAGGTDADVARVEPVLAAMAARVFHVGGLGAGHAAKALNNVLSACGLLIASETTEVARRFGLDPQAFLELVNQSTGRNDATENKIAKFVLSERYDSGFAATLMAKDLRIARDLAASTGAPTRLLRDLTDAWAEAIEQLPPGADQTEVARHLAKEN